MTTPATATLAHGPRLRLALEPVALALLLAAVTSQWGRLEDWRAGLGSFQMLAAVAFVAYLLAVGRRAQWRLLPRGGAFVVLVAFTLRMGVLPVTPTLSDDVYRYAWEGRVLAAGENPWALPPDSPALAALRDDEVHPRINHPHLAAIYPPFTIAGFALVAQASYTLLAFKGWVLLHDLALCILLAVWCAARGRSAWDSLVYAWNPLVVAEYAGSGHFDPTALFWFAAALFWAETRPRRSATSGLAAVMGKLVALPAWPFLVRHWPTRVRWGASALLALGLAGYLALTWGPHSGFAAFASTWRHNEALFGPLAALTGDRTARIVMAFALLALLVVLIKRGVPTLDGVRTMMRTGLLLGPVVHPWYLGWVLVLEPHRPSWPWLLLSGTVLLSYGVGAPPAEGGAWHPGPIVRLVEYGVPVSLAIILHLLRLRERRVRTPH